MKKILCVWVIVCSLFVVNVVDAALTKSVAAVDEWLETAQNAVREGATVDISGDYYAALHIDMAITSTAAHTGSIVWVQVSSNTSGDEDWTTLEKFPGPTGTANSESLSGAEAAAQTVLEVADTTGFYDNDEARWIFIEDNVVANSEMCLLVSHVGNTSVTVQDGITNAHDASDTLFDIAENWVINIPPVYSRVRVIFDNTFDSDGATIHTRTRLSRVTEL
jgi:hypothetical protein